MTRVLMLLIVLMLATSCELVEGIFKAGVGVGIFIVIAIVGIIILILSKIGGKN
ncbi:hypothetical protein [Flavobacterium sp.]|uniref:hypothetical protein n=1 Tax=Flavobacterium sp. TaxID=239 RepID=UPI0026327D9C|nr:hypothetical protein [Flavobacterium sp.]